MRKALTVLITLVLLSATFAVPAAAWSLDGRKGARWPIYWMPWFAPKPEERDPVIFVHGWSGGYGASPWGLMQHRLVQDGWPSDRIYEIFYRHPTMGSNVDNAEQLAEFVDKVLEETGAEKVDFIGHSMGGISTRYYIKFLGGDEKVDDYVALGTPQHGVVLLSIPSLAWLIAGGREMVPGGEFLEKLNGGDETPGNVSYTSLGSRTDQFVQPSKTIALDGADNKWVFLCGHVQLLFNREVYEWTKEALLT